MSKTPAIIQRAPHIVIRNSVRVDEGREGWIIIATTTEARTVSG